MNTQTSDLASSKKVRRGSYRRAGLTAAALVALCAVNVQAQWANPDTTNPPGLGQRWAIGANWTSGVPAANTVVSLWRGTSNPAYVLLDTETNQLTRLDIRNGSNLLIASGGHLKTSQIDFTSGVLTLTTGGKITLKQGAGNSDAFLLTGGSVGTYVQSGGDFLASDIQFRSGATVRVSGGTLTTQHTSSGLWFRSGGAARFEVIGSGATITHGGFRADVTNGTFAFVLDNSAAHISKIRFGTDSTRNNGQHGATLRSLTSLDVSLAGGVLLTSNDNYTIIERSTGTDTAWKNSATLNRLWADTTSTTNKADITIGFREEANLGTLDVAAGAPEVDFGGAFNYGYIEFANVNLGEPLQLALDITGGTLSNFTNALDGAGIAWTAGVGDYEVILSLDPSVSGDKYFAWDFAKIDTGMGLQGIALYTIPEPSTYAVVAGLGILSVAAFRRRRN